MKDRTLANVLQDNEQQGEKTRTANKKYTFPNRRMEA